MAEEPEFQLDGDELPPFANADNKALHADIKTKEKSARELKLDIDENSERIKVMTDHLSNVQHELLSTQQLVDAKKKEVDTEEHMEALARRQVGRLVAEMNRLRQLVEQYSDRTNSMQNELFRGNEELDQFKLQMNWNQEELEQWSLAARQKEEDELTLEKYRRADEAKTKELKLSLERLSVETAAKKAGLEKEVTETQALQIEMDKTAEQFKALHDERKNLIRQWEEAVKNMKIRDKQLEEKAKLYADHLGRKRQKDSKLSERHQFLENALRDNEKVQMEITQTDRQLARVRTDFMEVRDGLTAFKDEVEVLKNQLAAAAHEQVSERNNLVSAAQQLEQRKARLSEMERKKQATLKRLGEEKSETKNVESLADQADKFYVDLEQQLKTTEKNMKAVKEQLFKQSQELYELRQEEATTLGEISGAQSAIKNLAFQIQKLDQERQRQQELLYAVDFQSQSMQRKVARVSGERTLEEKDDLMQQIESSEKELAEKTELWTMLTNQHKKQDAELRAAHRGLDGVKQDQERAREDLAELHLQTGILERTVASTIKEKEEVLVHHDVTKLEVTRLRNKLSQRTEQVFSLENRKQQLSLSMQEREKEVEVHLDVLKAQNHAAMEDRHATAIELAKRKQKIHTLKTKYEAAVARTKKTDEPEHSQAYYVLQAAQAKEELQRKGDELDAKIRKAEREIRALENTLAHLLTRNQKYKDNFKKVDKTAELQVQEKSQLEEQARAANEVLFRKKQELARVDKEYEEDSRRLSELQRQQHALLDTRMGAFAARQQAEEGALLAAEQLEHAVGGLDARVVDARTQGLLGEPAAGFAKSLTEVELDVHALRVHNEAVLQAMRDALDPHPRAREAFAAACSRRGLDVH